MVDIISTTVFGSRPGALDNWVMGVQDILSLAVNDFPTRGIVVCILYGSVEPPAKLRFVLVAELYPRLGMERGLPDP